MRGGGAAHPCRSGAVVSPPTAARRVRIADGDLGVKSSRPSAEGARAGIQVSLRCGSTTAAGYLDPGSARVASRPGGQREEEYDRLFQEQIRGRVGHAAFLVRVRFVATLRRRRAGGGRDAQNAFGLGELTGAFARFDVEQQPRDSVPARRWRIGLDGADDLAAVAAFPGRAAVVLADRLLLRVEQLGLRALEIPCPRARG